MSNDMLKSGPIQWVPHHDYNDLINEINLLSGRVDLLLRTTARIIAKIDPAFTEDPYDPDVQRKNKLLEQTVLTKMKQDALAQAAHDPEQFAKLQRYFKDIV